MRWLLPMLGFWASLSLSEAAALTMALVDDKIEVDIGYTGAKITVFATSDIPDENNVEFRLILAGPQRAHRLTMRHGSQSESFNFIAAPTVWLTAGEDGNQLPLSAQALQRHGLDVRMQIKPDSQRINDPRLPDWQAALVRLKQDHGLFAHTGKITRLGKTLLRADFALPAGAPPGLYQIRALAFVDGVLQAQSKSSLELRRKGIENWLFELAYNHAELYGLLAVLIGLLVGAAGALLGRY